MTTTEATTPAPSRPPRNGEPRRRILHFRRVFSLFSEPFIHQPIRELVRRGAKVRVATVVRYREGAENLPTFSVIKATQKMQGGTFLRRMLGWLFRMSQPDMMLWPIIRLALIGRIRKFQPEFVHAHFGPDGCLIAPIARKLRIPMVVGFYGYDVSVLLHAPKSAWPARFRAMFEHADHDVHAIAISNHVANKLRSIGIPDDRIHIIRLGIRVEQFLFDRDYAPRANNIVRCLHIGRLTPKKGPVKLVRAFAQARELLNGRVDLRLTIAGDGEMRQQVQREIETLGLNDCIDMLGAVKHERVPELLRESDIYTQHCVTGPDGDMEGLGVTFMEASATGLPIAATRHNGIPDIVHHEQNGLLSPEGDVDAMAEHIVRLAESPELREQMGRRGQAMAQELFTLEQTVDRYLELYEGVLLPAEGN